MPELENVRLALTVTTSDSDWSEEEVYEWPHAWRTLQRGRAASRLAELPDYLAFATILALGRDWDEFAHEQLPEAMIQEVEAALAFARQGSRWSYQFTREDEFDDVRQGLRYAGERLLSVTFEREKAFRRLRPSEYDYLRRLWREARIDRMRAERWHRSPGGLFGSSVGVERLRIASPGEIVFVVLGPLGVSFAIMVVTQWLATRAQHDQIDLVNKRLAAEAAGIVLERFKQDTSPISPDVVAAVITNARIAPVPLPPIANVKIDIA